MVNGHCYSLPALKQATLPDSPAVWSLDWTIMSQDQSGYPHLPGTKEDAAQDSSAADRRDETPAEDLVEETTAITDRHTGR